MKRFAIFVLIAAACSSGCASMNNSEKGALGGGAIGAGVGTAIGVATGNPEAGAIVGGLVGAGTGALIGNDIDNQEKKEARIQQASANQAAAQAYADAQPQRIAEIISLAGQSDQVVINHIRANHMTFRLTSADLNMLKTNGISDRVIAEMQTVPAAPVVVRHTRPVIVREPVYLADPYCYGPPPVFIAPRPVVGVGFAYRR